MKFTEFGKTGLTVSEIGFGGSRIGGFFAAGKRKPETLQLLQSALDAGITFYDTADMYAQGESESLLGEAFRGRRSQVIIATKAGFRLPAQRNLLKSIKPLLRPVVRALRLKRTSLPASISGSLSQDFSPAYLTRALEASLRRLKTDYVDLYQLHSPSVEFMQSGGFAQALQTLDRLKAQGKIRHYGVATEVPQDAPTCLSAPGLASVQLGFGLLDPHALEQGTLAGAAGRGLAVIARGCFGGGLLKDQMNEADLRAATPKWPQILALRSLSERMGRSLLDVALQFSRGTPAIAVTLLGMHSNKHLQDILGYAAAARLTAEEYCALLECRPQRDTARAAVQSAAGA